MAGRRCTCSYPPGTRARAREPGGCTLSTWWRRLRPGGGAYISQGGRISYVHASPTSALAIRNSGFASDGYARAIRGFGFGDLRY